MSSRALLVHCRANNGRECVTAQMCGIAFPDGKENLAKEKCGEIRGRFSPDSPHSFCQGGVYAPDGNKRGKMRNFKHLTKTARLQLEMLLKANMPKKQIAELLGVHLSTVYREIRRGEYDHLDGSTWISEKRYSADKAHNKYLEHLKEKGVSIKLGKDHDYAEYIERRIVDDKLSPGAVLGEIKTKGLLFDTSISINTLYKYIERGYFLRLGIKHLPMKAKRKRSKRVVVTKRAPRGKSIEQRPLEILERRTFGHWEMDCVCGPTRNSLLVLTERLTRKEIIIPMRDQTAHSVVRALNALERKYGKRFKNIFKTITVDNGSEFSDYDGIEKSVYGRNNKRTTVYYCHPYTSCERGTNERINREIRRLIPKGTDLSILSAADVQKVEDWVNDYPRRIFDYHTSRELFRAELSAAA